jgi:hypothetical protein
MWVGPVGTRTVHANGSPLRRAENRLLVNVMIELDHQMKSCRNAVIPNGRQAGTQSRNECRLRAPFAGQG